MKRILPACQVGPLVPGGPDDLQDVDEKVDDVQVEVEGGEHVLLGVQRVLQRDLFNLWNLIC